LSVATSYYFASNNCLYQTPLLKIVIACSFLLHCNVFFCAPTELHADGDVELPTPAAILGSLDPNAGAADPTQGRVPCLRESPAHTQFLFLFAKTVVMQDAYRKNTRDLLGGFMCPNLEAFAVLTYTNNYDCWKEECEIQALPPEERVNRTLVAVRRFTDRARGAGRYRGWDSAGITM
jgi:hypothetical protein